MNDTISVYTFLEDMPPDTCTQIQRNLFVKTSGRNTRLDLDQWADTFKEFLKEELEMKESFEEDFTYRPDACQGCGNEPGDGIDEYCNEPLGCGYYKQWRKDVEKGRG